MSTQVGAHVLIRGNHYHAGNSGEVVAKYMDGSVDVKLDDGRVTRVMSRQYRALA